ncbi:Arm DNA-binding domain-containing protein [Clostridium sp. 1xD42-85]|uniref:Arm DNA-binding domain-containing protein n=1 Tax=Clostridia TaxID=186801 RepID=UPI00268739D4
MFRHRYYDSLDKRREKTKRGYKKENEAYMALLEVKTNIITVNRTRDKYGTRAHKSEKSYRNN